MFAEISDKMVPVHVIWAACAVIGSVAYAITRACKPLALLGVSGGLLGLVFCGSEFVHDAQWASSVRSEMGLVYLLSAATLPGLAMIAGALLGLLPHSRIVPSCQCLCGYNLTGNTSGVCPECGERI